MCLLTPCAVLVLNQSSELQRVPRASCLLQVFPSPPQPHTALRRPCRRPHGRRGAGSQAGPGWPAFPHCLSRKTGPEAPPSQPPFAKPPPHTSGFLQMGLFFLGV